MKRPQLKEFSISQRVKSFKHAIEGLVYASHTQHNLWVHFLAGVVVILLGFVMKVTTLEWCILIFAIGFVLVAELFNTAIEVLTDLVSPGYHRLAKITKDVSAAAVLIASIVSLVIGIIIFYQS